MKYSFHPEALREFQAAAVFYENKQHGLGVRFANAVQVAVDHAVDVPRSGRVLENEVRRYLTKVFSYAV